MASVVTISVVFTDLVGSTEMASRLGSVRAEEVRQVHFGLLRGAIAETAGTEVKNLGDGFMVVFGSLRAALDGSVAMQQAIRRHNDKGGEPLAVRVGVGFGDATRDGDDYFGAPVVEAARLCAQADGAQILTTEAVALVAGASGHSFHGVGSLELKGLPEPVVAVEVGWAPAPDPAALDIPFPVRVDALSESMLVGRSDEWALLADAQKAARAGSRRVVFVAGEPGIGKTTLTSAACRDAFDAGAIVAYGRCDEFATVPYQPWVEILGHLVEHLPDDLLVADVADHGGELARLVPSLARRVEDLPAARATDPETERYLLFQAVTGLLSACAGDSLVVLLLDDLHWADKESLLLLRHISGAAPHRALLLFGTYRDSDMSKDSALAEVLAGLRRDPGVERVALAGLDGPSVMELLELTAGHTIEGDGAVAFAHAIGRETAGNPFFVGEILRSLVEDGSLVQGAAGRWAVSDAVDGVILPESVREVVGKRVARLGEEMVRVLAAASVIGRDFDLSVLAQVLGESEDAVYDHLQRSVVAALTDEVPNMEDRFTFRHALVQQSLVADLPARRRRQLHQSVAEVLERTWSNDDTKLGELAGHWLAAAVPAATTKALHYAQLAGDQALARLAPVEAIRWYSAALDLIQDDPGSAQVRCGLLVGLGSAQRQTGDPEYRETLLRAAGLAHKVGDVPALVTAALANNRGLTARMGDFDADRVETIKTALAAVGPGDSASRSLLITHLAVESAFGTSPSDLEDLTEQAISMARRVGDPAALLEALVLPIHALMRPATHDLRASYLAEAMALSAEVGDAYLHFWTLWHSAVLAIEEGDIDSFDAHHRAAADLVSQLRQPMLEWFHTCQQAMRATIGGDHVEGERLASLALELATDLDAPDGFTLYGAMLLAIRRSQGQSEEVMALLSLVNESLPHPSTVGYLASIQCEADRHDEARALLRELLDAGMVLPDDPIWPSTASSWSVVASELHDPTAAAAIYSTMVPFEHLVSTTGVTVNLAYATSLGQLAAVLGRIEDAERHFQVGERICTQMGATYNLARNCLEWSIALARIGQADRSRRLARQALDQSAGRFAYIDRRAAILAS